MSSCTQQPALPERSIRNVCQTVVRNHHHYLEAEDDDNEDGVGCEEDAGLFDGAAVSEEADDEDEGPESDEDVGGIVNQNRINEFLQ